MTNANLAEVDPGAWKQGREAIRPRFCFGAQSSEEARAWQHALRERFAERLGGFPCEPWPLDAIVDDESRGEGYTRWRVRFWSREGLRVWGYWLVPDGLNAPRPAILCLHGHGPGVAPLVGLRENGAPLQEADYQNEFALGCVQRGYPTLAIELLGFGRRRTQPSSETPGGCQTLSGSALMLGQTMAAWRVYDAMRALDFLVARPEVDSARLGAMGISGGGLVALFLSALDERVGATVVSGYLNTFRASVMALSHCIDNFVPGLLLDAEMSDIAGLVAPRLLWCENGVRDPIFPVETFRSALENTKHIYDVFGAPDACDGEVFDDGHRFWGRGAWAFLERHRF